MNDLLDSVLGTLNDILGAIAAQLNILGGAINFVLNLLGISCSGPDRSCSKTKQICTNGAEKLDEEGDFLDDLLSSIDNLFPSTGADYTQYVCGDAYKGTTLEFTTVGFTCGVPAIPGTSGNIPDADNVNNTADNPDDNNGVKQLKRISYDIADIIVEEGDTAQFVVKRSGYTEVSSSITYKTLKHRGSAKENEDYLPVNDILGFAPGETEKTISVRTITSAEREKDEDFYLLLKRNTPSKGSKVQSAFIKNVAICTITEGKVKEPYNPWRGPTKNPFDDLEEVFNPDLVGPIDDGLGDNQQTDDNGDGLDDNTGEDIVKLINVVADRQTCPEGEFITYTITTTNVENGSIYYYTLSGNGITSEDIIGGHITGSFVVNSNTAKVVVGIENDGVVEDDEVLRFTVNGTGAFVDVIITTDDDDYYDGYGEGPRTDTNEFRVPTVDQNNIITDDNGGIIEIPIENPGDRWAEPPYVFITGQGIGATATALLDGDGYLTEIRIKSSGYGYRKNLAADKGKRCIIDAYTVSRPGIGYTDKPTIYVNGRTDVAEAIINDDGFVIGARTLDRVTTYDKFPEIIIVGGGGYGAKLLPSLVCLDEQQLTTIGSTKIGTGRYIDCP